MEYVLAAIVQLLRAAIKDSDGALYGVKCVYDGDPIKIPESNMPALVVMPEESAPDPEHEGTRTQRMIHQVRIALVYNEKAMLGAAKDDPYKVAAVRESIRRMEATGIDHSTESKSVRGIILRNPFLPYTPPNGGTQFNAADFSRYVRTSYDFTRNRGFPAYEVSTYVNATVVGDRG